jgi:hypothetical protein
MTRSFYAGSRSRGSSPEPEKTCALLCDRTSEVSPPGSLLGEVPRPRAESRVPNESLNLN